MGQKKRSLGFTLWRILVFWPAIIIGVIFTIYTNVWMGNSVWYTIIEIPLYVMLIGMVDGMMKSYFGVS